jgi:hypothetical protein
LKKLENASKRNNIPDPSPSFGVRSEGDLSHGGSFKSEKIDTPSPRSKAGDEEKKDDSVKNIAPAVNFSTANN